MQKLTRNKFAYSGWLAAALIVGVFAGTGFQDSMKLGVVDINRVVVVSGLQAEAEASLRAAGSVREAILDYMQQEQVMTRLQCDRLREIELKSDKTDQDIAELSMIKSAVTDAVKDLDFLNTKGSELTEEERRKLGDYNDRKNKTGTLWNEWRVVFETEFQDIRIETQTEMIAKAQAATQEVAKRGGYTLIFSMTAAVYAANDITDEVIKEAEK